MQDHVSTALLKSNIVFDLKEPFSHYNGFTLMCLSDDKSLERLSRCPAVNHLPR